MPREALLDLVLDCFGIDPVTNEVSLSMISLDTRYQERTRLENHFILTGGSFVQLNRGEDPELA
jgi:hypothetical protein